MAENITRCPKCHTSFRITDAHLKSAKGSVRCGSCLTIFNAIDHLAIVTNSPTEDPTPAAEEQETEDMLISDDMGLEPEEETFSDEFNESTGTSQRHNTGEFSLFERDPIKNDEQDSAEIDDSWALGLIEDNHDEPDPAQREDQEEEFESIFEENVGPENTDLPDKDTDYESFYGTDKFQILDEEPDDIEPEFRAQLEGHYDHHPENNFHEEFEEEKKPAVSNNLSAQFLDSIEPEPVEFTWKPHGQWWHSKPLWFTLCFVALLGLSGQIAWFKKATLSLDPRFRPYYELACQKIECHLPVQKDISKISARNLVVRPNPKQENSLVIDFILQNSANFQQSFPAIELAFTDHKEQVIAARCFPPADYLGGELSGAKNMPVRQPIHIAIEILHPGESATGYKIGICP